MTVVLVGTASWSSKSLVDSRRFYPPEVRTSEQRLRHYAGCFPLVEVDSSYYAMPVAATTRLWAERTPPGFTMNVKAFRLFTGHQTAPVAFEKDLRAALPASTGRHVYYRQLPAGLIDECWRRFLAALVPLREAERLGLVHFQFPPWIERTPDGIAHVRECVERMTGQAVSLEFRHRSWFADARTTASTLALERELGVVHTVVDAPQGPANSVPAIWEATHPTLVLVRLHGRNRDTWNLRGATDSSERFNYDYPEDELVSLATGIGALAARGFDTHVVFNNNMEDQGQRNAATMMRLLDAAGVPTPHLRSSPE